MSLVGVPLVGVPLVSVPSNAAAEEPVAEAVESADKSPGQQESQRELGYVLLGTSCAIGLGMIGAFWFIRRRRRDEALLDFEEFAPISERDFSQTHRRLEASGKKRDASSEPAGISADTVMEALSSSAVDFAPQHGHDAKRECPKCSRAFPSTILVCPYDSSPLRSASKRRRRKRRRDPHGLDRLVCTGCERRFEQTADFCYHDGLPLMQDTRERAQSAPIFKACEACGWEGEGDEHTLCPNEACPGEARELVEIDPSDSTHVQPTIPMSICPTCREYAAPGKAFCPNDGDVLTPLLNMRSTEFPVRGFGPKRKVCPDCGTEHGGHASYCCNDGTRLVALN